ncbi:TIGR02147 family protein [Bdellovibrio sp.]|uniref:TIGR02147 family protein n=1 Tax=Bdellovibrio sp. TaxID=28201 RepID=UPI0039E4E8D4
MSIFNYIEYRKYLKATLESKPRKGYGELSKWAESCNIHPTLLSLILKGDRELSLEQAFALSHHLGLSAMEQEYFILLVQHSRAGTSAYKAYLQKKIDAVKDEATTVKKRFRHESEISDEAKMIFYSSYIYSAIRLYCDVSPNGVSSEMLIEKFNLDRRDLQEKLQFLLHSGLILEQKGRYKLGPSRTMVGRESVFVTKHHQNWRIQAILKAERLSQEEMMFTCPMVLSKADFAAFKVELSELIQKFSTLLKDSKSEEVGCFNIDWFWL